MNWQDLCCMCCSDRQAFWDKLARQVSALATHASSPTLLLFL